MQVAAARAARRTAIQSFLPVSRELSPASMFKSAQRRDIMKKLGYVIAALGAIAIAAPSIASAETVVIRHGGHHYGARAEFREHRDHGWHEGWRHRHADRMVIVRHRHHHED